MTVRTDSTTPSDPMGGLLDRSAPATPADDALRDAIAMMAADARREARSGAAGTTRRRSAVRVAVVGTIAAALVGVGGVAVAASLISWGPEYENPDTEFSVTLPSGRLCEARYVAEATYPDGGPEAPGVNAELQAWLSAQDFAGVDLGAGERQVAEWDAQSPDQTVVIGPDGWLMDVPEPPSVRTEDDTYAFVLSQAVKAEIVAGIEQLGLYEKDDWSVIGDIKCELVVE